MADHLEADICVIGAGSAGLSVAAGAARFGASTVLIERDRMGGECLNTGCIPSKSLLAAANAAQSIRFSGRFGIDGSEPRVDYARVRRHVEAAIGEIAPADSVERFEGLGVTVIRAEACFLGPREIEAGGRRIRARRVVVAAGSSPAIPPIPGLEAAPYLTNETVFRHEVLPEHLVVIGGGPIGIELAQAYRRLGSRVTVLEERRALSHDDPELASLLVRRLEGEGVEIREGVEIKRVDASAGTRIRVVARHAGQMAEIEGSHLLVAAGRRPNVGALGLPKAGIAWTDNGIVVDGRLRTTARGVYAIGDVSAGPRFTHVADYQAKIVIRNALLRLPAKVNYRSLPWVTFTDPELAQAGLTEEQARREHGRDVEVVRADFSHNDRARTERSTFGRAKIVARRNGRVLGASILGPHAGELIHLWVLAIEQGLKLRHVAGMLAPYPTFGQISTRAAGEFYAPKLFNAWSRGVVRALGWLP